MANKNSPEKERMKSMAKETGSAQPVNLKKNDTVVLTHGCKNEWQDQRYGKGMRLFNTGSRENNPRCTACGQLRNGK